MQKDESFDVVIVGGGIGGSSLGASLAQAGQSVLLLERTTEFEDRVRGEWLAPWGTLEAKELGLYDTLIEAGGHVLGRNIAYDEMDDRAGLIPATVPLRQLLPGSDGPLCLEHVVMQNTLLERAGKSGVQIRRGVSGVEIETEADPVVRYQVEGEAFRASCRLIVGADGRASKIRRQAGIVLEEDPVDHLLAGLLVEGAHGWPEDLQSIGKVGDINYLVFPQGGGKVRLYADFSIKQKDRFAGKDGARKFLESFAMDCVPNSESLVQATPIGPCGSFPSQDAWTEEPFAKGVVLVGDAAGYNDPIIGQGMSVTLRDVRIVRDLLLSGADWEPGLFVPYATERKERLRRLRLTAMFTTRLYAKFEDEDVRSRARARARIAEEPQRSAILAAAFMGPEMLPAELFDEALIDELFEP